MTTKSASSQSLRIWLLLGAILILLGAGLPLLLPGAGEAYIDTGDPEPFAVVEVEAAPKNARQVVEATSERDPQFAFTDKPKKVAGTSGTIHCTVGLAAPLIDKVETATLVLMEAINPNKPRGSSREALMYRKQISFEPGRRLAYHDFEDLAFSEYGWNLRVFCPGVNGSELVLMLSEEDSVKSVHLNLSPATSLRITLKDQQYLPVAKVRVYLKPSGSDTRGRPGYPGNPDTITDNTGFLLIDNVLAGEYTLLVGDPRQPLIPPQKVMIGEKETQLLSVEVPRGGDAIFRVSMPGGYGAPDVEVQAVAKESKIYRQHKGKTNRAGLVELKHLPAGDYFVYFTKKGFSQAFKQVTVPPTGKVEYRIALNLSR